MKENSREENIKILEEFIDGLKQYNPKTGKDIKPTRFGEGQRYVYSNVYYAIEYILSDYKRALKENEELKDKYATFVKMSSEVIANSIPVQKVKDKIEKLQKGPLKINENNKYYYETEAYNKIIIQVLQELIEREE